MNLFEINDAIERCVKLESGTIVDMETGEVIDTEALDQLVMDRDTKIRNIACWIKNLESDEKALADQIKTFTARKNAAKNKRESLKSYLAAFLNGKKWQNSEVAISWRKSEAVEVEEGAAIPEKYLRFKGDYEFKIADNKAQKTYIDLKKFTPTASDSILFSQVRVPSAYRSNGYCWVGAVDNITDLGVTLKTSPDKVLVWVTSLETGKPLSGLSVELRDQDNKVLWQNTTDKQGIAWAPGLEKLQPYQKYHWERPVIYAFVTSPDGDAVLASNWNDGLEPWRFNINYDYDPEDSLFKTALFTDRGVYRPGETVYLKGVAREKKQGKWSLPSGKEGQVVISNSRGEEVFKKTLSYGVDTGAFDWKFTLPADAVTGSWTVAFTPVGKGDDTLYTFQVEAVKPAEIQINLQPFYPSYISGERAIFSVAAQYLFGSPVAEGKVKWTVRRSNDWFHPKGYEDYDFDPYFLTRDEGDDNEEGLLTESSATLDRNGKINFAVNLPTVKRRQMLYAEVGVQTLSNQELFTRIQVPLNPADFYLGAKLSKHNVGVGQPIEANLVAVDFNGNKLDQPIEVIAKIQKEEYFSVRKNGLAGRLEWVNEKKVIDLPSRQFQLSPTGTTFSFTPDQPGTYFVTLQAKDSQDRIAQGGFDFWVYGKDNSYWKQNDDDILQLKQDKNIYKPGENARILVESPYEQATALVTVEREGILDAWTTSVSSGVDYIDVPIKSVYTPNVFVGVTLVRGRMAKPSYDEEGLDLAKPQGKTGYVQLTLDQAEQEIQTAVTTDKQIYRPGKEVTVVVHTRVKGKNVPADVTLMVVDEGILSLTGYETPNLMKIFYGAAPLSVFTADNRSFLIGQRNFGEKGENRGGGGGLLAKWSGTDLRSNFEFTPYFKAQLKTNAQGRAETRFKLPDNLTTWRIMAVSAKTAEFGAGQTTIKSSKPLMIIPKLPRFVRLTDKFECGMVIYNNEDERGSFTVDAQSKGSVRLSSKEKHVHVDKGEAKAVTWPCEAVEEGDTKISFAVTNGRDSDAISVKLPVKSVEKQEAVSLYASTNKREDQLIQKPDFVDEDADNRIVLSLSSSALVNLRGSMEYLLTYPYDCLEQKLSKIRPIIENVKLVQDFGFDKQASAKKEVQKVLDELSNYQHASGGLAYWPGAKPDPYVTTYALEVAHRAKEEGYNVPMPVLEKAMDWLEDMFDTRHQLRAYPYSMPEENTSRAYAIYILALYGKKLTSQFNALYLKRNALSVSGKASLLLAAPMLGADQTVKDNLAQELLNQAVYGAQTLHFATTEEQPWLHIQDITATALVLRALTGAGNYLEQPHQVVRWLIEQMNAQGHWGDTSTNAAVLSALYTYYSKHEGVDPEFAVLVMSDEKKWFEAAFRGRSVKSYTTSLPFNKVYEFSDIVRMQVIKQGIGTLYYSLVQKYIPSAYRNSVNAGFEVSRQLTNLQGQEVFELQAGQRYKVTLTVKSTTPRSFVVLEDFIPAGVEILQTSLATESQEDASNLNNYDRGGFERDEKYDDRIAIFADYLAAGEHSYSYLVQASVTGQYSYPAAWASQMYDEAVFGHMATTTLEVRP